MYNPSQQKPSEARNPGRHLSFIVLILIGLIVIPLLYYTGRISIETVNMLGRYLAFAIMAVMFAMGALAMVLARRPAPPGTSV